MSSVSSSHAPNSRRQYFVSRPFNENFFSYSTFVDTFTTRGRLTTVPGATALNCKAGAILRETGKKLFSLTHPDLNDPTTGNPYSFLVGVYDITTGFNGFIDPNFGLFGVFTTDKSYQQDLTANPTDATVTPPDAEAGPAVYTFGISNFINGLTTNSITASNAFVGSAFIRKVFVDPVTAGNGVNIAPITSSAGTGNLSGNTAQVFTTQLTPTSLVLVTVNSATPQKVGVVKNVGASNFQVFTDAGGSSTFDWLIIS